MRFPLAAVLLLAGLLFLGDPAAAAPPVTPGAFTLLKQVRQTYSSLRTYQDRGEIEIIRPGTGEVERHAFDLAMSKDQGGFRFAFESPEAPERSWVVSRLGDPPSVPRSPAAEIVAAFGEGAQDALAVPVFLAGGKDSLSDPEAATVEGPEPCGAGGGAGECWILVLAREGDLESRLWVDIKTSLIHQVETRLPGSARRSLIRVHHEKVSIDQPVAMADLAPPPPPPVQPASSRPDLHHLNPDEVFQAEITVSLATVAVRVLGPDGKPLVGLRPEDFRVRMGKKEIPVVAVDWTTRATADEEPVADTATLPEPAPARPVEPLAAIEPAAPGKWVMFFVQADLEPSRIKGHMNLLPMVRKFLDTLDPGDRLAMVSYDSHLRLRLDWTGSRDAVYDALRKAVRFGGDYSVDGDGSVRESMKDLLDLDAARRAASPERALEVTADSLAALPGEKVVVYMGWGLGRYTPEGVKLTPTFKGAIKALRQARATVFVLDITAADYHSLEVGLEAVAAATGGTYAKTFNFPEQALKLLAQAISGYYVLSLDRNEIPAEGGEIRIELRDKKGVVLARPDAQPR
jgi:VWFA-related protein